jgi:hypothetical protein
MALRRFALGSVIALGLAAPAQAQPIIVDHTSLPLFEQIPPQFLEAAANLRMMFVNRSVGSNINDGLTCLTYPSTQDAPTACKRTAHVVPAFSSPASEVHWSRPGGYPRSNWQYFGWPGTGIPPELPCGVQTGFWYAHIECFVRYVDANAARFDVFSFQTSYLEVENGSDITHPASGFFARQATRFDISDLEALEARHPGKVFIYHTSSLARAIGSQVSTDFNNQLRQYVRANNKILLDVAAIVSHAPDGNPCYDNRDGVPYVINGEVRENYPDDGLDLPAICQHYTPEVNGGHLGNPDVAKIRVAKAFWILMARIAGWNPGTQTTPPGAPANLRIIR